MYYPLDNLWALTAIKSATPYSIMTVKHKTEDSVSAPKTSVRYAAHSAVQSLFISLMLVLSVCATANDLSSERQNELLHLLKHDCGSCHGMTLKGGLGPNLTAKRLNIFPRNYLFNTIKQGRPDTPMPPWGPILSDTEINWLLDQLLSNQQ